MSVSVDEILARLKDVRNEGGGWIACCPAHDDSRPSLRISRGEDGKALLFCRSSGCSYESILRGLGLWTSETTNGRSTRDYVYEDASGEPLFKVVRAGGKRFHQQRYDNSQWVRGKNCMQGVQRTLYRSAPAPA